MTEPTDAELDAVLCKHWPAFSMQAVLVRMWLRDAMRAALAKWGTPQPVVREPQWIDPNDKTQPQYLPHIGEPVLFCHKGNTYYGKHTGGSFVSGVGFAQKHFNTWHCHWMYPPAAHGITQKGGS